MFPTPTPFPQFVAHNTTDAQIIQVLNQIQNHQFTNNQAFFGTISLSIPFIPISWKLALYHILNSLPIPQLSPAFIILFLIFGPVIFLVALFLSVKYGTRLTRFLTPIILSYFSKTTQEKTFLELTFPHDTSKSAYATEQVYKLIHTLSQRNHGFLHQTHSYSLEIVSTKDEGIRYIMGVPTQDADIIHKTLMAYIAGLKVRQIPDYLAETSLFNTLSGEVNGKEKEKQKSTKIIGVSEFKQSFDFALPLANQKALFEHDPVSFLTGNMTKLAKGELIAFQIVINPSIGEKIKTHMQEIKNTIYQGKPLSPVLFKKSFLPLPPLLLFFLSPLLWLVVFLFRLVIHIPYLLLDPNGPQARSYGSSQKVQLQTILNPYEQELSTVAKEKLNQHLFVASIRLFIMTNSDEEFDAREAGLVSSFGQFSSPYQSLTTKGITPIPGFAARAFTSRLKNYFERKITGTDTILSSSELSDLYHFPNTDLANIEGVVKTKSTVLPAPRSMKQEETQFAVVVGENFYGGETVPVGITTEQRRRHMYVIGKSGMGKSEMIKNMVYQDMKSGNGLCVLDPHGDMFRSLLKLVPKERRKDVIVLDPSDREYPVGLNILSPGITFQNVDDGQEWITSSVLAIFAKLTDKEYWGPRMEHILQNATLTALKTPNPSLYTLQRLLTDPLYQKEVAKNLRDPVLKQFWEKEFSLFGTKQLANVIAPLTQRLGHFITATMSRNILMQEKSTINIQEIMDSGKILLVNLSKGDLGEDQSFFFGTILTSLIWMAAYQRTKIPEQKRRDFYLYVDEFQNFATPRFAEITSEGRKFRVSLTASHQNIAQVEDTNILKVVAGNANSIVALKAAPDDESFILPFMEPEVKHGDIINLAPFNFFMKVTTDESEDAFSGTAVTLTVKESDAVAQEIIDYSRKHYATPRKEVEKYLEKLFAGKNETQEQNGQKTTNVTAFSHNGNGIQKEKQFTRKPKQLVGM